MKSKIDGKKGVGPRGWLKNGNPPGDPTTAVRCGAKTRAGGQCKAPAMRNGRCRMHGGTSTGPRTAEGLARSKRSRWTHGLYSAEGKAEWKLIRDLARNCLNLLSQWNSK
jgi:hypothetical protein